VKVAVTIWVLLMVPARGETFEDRWLVPPPTVEEERVVAAAKVKEKVTMDKVCGRRGRYYFMKEGRRMWKCHRGGRG
jgi:hypothetical protein